MPNRTAIIISAFALLTGCSPIAPMQTAYTEYFRPEAPDGETVGFYYPTGVEFGYLPRNITFVKKWSNAILFTKGNVRILVDAAAKCKADTFTVYVRFQIPEGNSAEIRRPMVMASAGDVPPYLEAALRPYDNRFQFGSMVGETRYSESRILGTHDKTYFAAAEIPVPKSNTYRVILPEIIVNGIRFEFSEIEFSKVKTPEFFSLERCWW